MRVLIVEDEPNLGRQLRPTLEGAGYAVDLATDGEDGHYLGSTETYDAVVLDLLMPGMSGEQTYRSLRALKPNVRVLLVSGYSEGDILGRLGGGPNLAYLGKPFTRATLERKLRDLLG